jgi:hypothetical protein
MCRVLSTIMMETPGDPRPNVGERPLGCFPVYGYHGRRRGRRHERIDIHLMALRCLDRQYAFPWKSSLQAQQIAIRSVSRSCPKRTYVTW